MTMRRKLILTPGRLARISLARNGTWNRAGLSAGAGRATQNPVTALFQLWFFELGWYLNRASILRSSRGVKAATAGTAIF
jgi:hypothetical protein